MSYFLLIFGLLISTSYAFDGGEIKSTVVADSIGLACTQSKGEGQRKGDKECVKNKMVFDWANTDFGKCDYQKVGDSKKYKATWIIKYKCKEKD